MAISKTVSGAALESGYADNPGHTLSTESADQRFTISAARQEIITSSAPLILREASYPPVHYYPRTDVDMSLLHRTDKTTWCPFKGRASYFSIGDDPALENAVWSYEDPFLKIAAIKDHLAFYEDKIAITKARD